jgi:hypothetical protein
MSTLKIERRTSGRSVYKPRNPARLPLEGDTA